MPSERDYDSGLLWSSRSRARDAGSLSRSRSSTAFKQKRLSSMPCASAASHNHAWTTRGRGG